MFTRSRISWSTLLVPLLVSLVLVVAICSVLYLREADQVETNMLDREQRRVEIFAGLFARDISSAVTDLRALVTGDGLQTYLASGQATDLDRAEHRAMFFSKENPDYDQVRYLDEQGQEMLRVDRNGVAIPREQLQNKADRSYFQKAARLAPGEIFISAIDLNVERGVIEQPIKPMLRLAMPVFDANGRRRGIYVINYLVANSIERLRQFVPRYQQRLRLLNAQGYWLKAERPEEEWGFMLPGREGMTLARTNPDLWARIVREPEGQAPYGGGYFTWFRFVPRDSVKSNSVSLVADDDFVVFASEISSSEWIGAFIRLRQTFVVVAALLLVLATVAGWFFYARRRVQQERDRFFNLTRDLLCVAGFDGYFKRVNPAWEKAIGYTSEELKAKPFLDFVHPDDREKTSLETSRLALGGEVISFENRYRCKDGSYRWLVWSARSLVREGLIYGSARDMTERKNIEESLRQSEERIRLMIESIKDYAIFLLDTGGRVVTWNSGAERLKGYRAEEIIGQHFSRFYPEEKIRERFPEMELKEATAKGRFEDEGWRVRKDGSRFWANVVINAVHNSQGDLLGFVKVTRDVTTRKEAEERIHRLNEELKQRASLLEVANKELESFSYSVSHDLRAPLRHIHGFVELLQEAPALKGDEESHRQMNIIAKAAREMGRLIDDLLAFSRTGRAEMHPSEIDMREMIDQIIQDRALECQGRRVTWEIKPLSRVAGDPGLLRLVWTNLLDNALKYTRKREEAKIEIGQAADRGPDASGRREMVFYVRDNGVGFDMQYASKLFGVFQRLHRAEDFEGTGIGLANVQRIIHRHGGRVWAEAQVDAGATFYFSLPLIAVQTGEPHGKDQKNPVGGRQ